MNTSPSFQKFGGLCAILAGVAGFLYSVSFIVIARSNPEMGVPLYSLFLMLGGLFSSAVFVALYFRGREIDGGFALWALLLGIVAAAGSLLHGAYDLANAINPPIDNPVSLANLPNQVNPRGLLTFGIAGMAVFVFSMLIARDSRFPKNLAYLGYALSVLLIVIYLGRLIILDATSMIIVIPALLTGFIINPLWNIWLGLTLRRD